jgi:hypothetical protein
MSAAQLAFPTDALRDDLTPAEVAAVEARVEHEDRVRDRYATPARPCRCSRPWPIGDECVKCGRRVE